MLWWSSCICKESSSGCSDSTAKSRDVLSLKSQEKRAEDRKVRQLSAKLSMESQSGEEKK